MISVLLLFLGIAIGLQVGSLFTQKALLKMSSYDKVMAWGKEDDFEPYTVLKVLIYIRKNIRELI
jgi:hypothetical protein